MKSQASLAIATLVIALGFMLFFNQPEKEAAYAQRLSSSFSSVSDNGSGIGTLKCPKSGETHQAAIAFEAFAPSGGAVQRGAFDISSQSSLGTDVFKSGTITGGQISPSGHFILRGTETSDNICGGTTSVSIIITGQCVQSGGSQVTVTFMASNGERASFPASPACT
jgi:hypothetical protein